jgi:drug/metabolite transporter (DMT)-like permease
MKSKLWLVFSIVTVAFWGVWGATIEIPEKAGFPASLAYVVWSLTMIIPALFALRIAKWKLETDRKAILSGMIIGFTGTGGQLVLFQALVMGPAYLVFPFISLSPLITIILSYTLLKERSTIMGWIGIFTALVAMPLLSYQTPDNNVSGYFFIVLSLFVLLAWGVQAYFIKIANLHMKAESIFVYMTICGLLLIPVALFMTDFSLEINWGFKGPYLAAMIQILNAAGALMLVYAFRYGKAIIVSPLINAGAPVITVIISLSIYAVIPHPVILAGMILAIIAILLMTQAETRQESS